MSSAGWAWLVLLAAAAPGMELVELKVAGRVVTVEAADVDGDGDRDVLVFWRDGYPPEAATRVSLFAAAKGKVAARPVQVLRLPDWTVAFDVGDTDGDGRADVLLLAHDGVWAHAGLATGRLADKPAQVIEVMTLAAFPHEDHVPPIDMHIRLEQQPFLLVPTVPIGPLGLYRRDPDTGWRLLQVLRVPTRSDLHTSAEDFRSVRTYGASFRLTYPRWVVADQDGDGVDDLLFFTQDELAVFRRRDEGTFPARPDLYRCFGMIRDDERIQRSLHVRGEAGDVDGDGRADLLFNKTVGGINNMKTELRLYLAGPDGDYPKAPAMSSRRDGWGSSARLVDVDGDGRDDLIRPHVEMGISALIGMMLKGRLDVTFEVTLSGEGCPGERPDLVLESPLAINFQSAQELQGPFPLLSTDFNGDGRADLVIGRAGAGAGDKPDRLELRPGTGPARFDSDPVWGIDLAGTRFVMPYRVRDDARPGLLIWFSLVEKMHGDVWVVHNRS